MRYAGRAERRFVPAGMPTQGDVTFAETAHDRAHVTCAEPLIDVVGHEAVVDRRGRIVARQATHQGEPTAHAEADDAHAAGAVIAFTEKPPGRVNVGVRRTVTAS